MHTAYTVRPASAADLPAAVDVLARAFSDAEQLAWLQPDPERRARLTAVMFDASLRHLCPIGLGTEVSVSADRINGVAVWAPPGRWKPSLLAQARTLPRIAKVLGIGGFVSFAMRTKTLMGAFIAMHPTRPHWHLVSLGVDPAARRGGAGTGLVQSGLARCDRLATPAYLECTEALAPFYERLGFVSIGVIPMPDGAPVQFGMWREPQGSRQEAPSPPA